MPSQTIKEKNDVSPRKKRTFWHVKKNFCEKKANWWKLMLPNFFFFKNNFFWQVKMCALYASKRSFFRYLSARMRCPSDVKKIVLLSIRLQCLQSDRTECADHEYNFFFQN